jgi:4'-phosphopantetheinyl transferase
MLKVYLADITPFRNPQYFDQKQPLVRTERRKKIAGYRSPEDRARGLAAGILLKEALEKEGISYETAVFAYEENGKPYLKDAAVFYSISHAGELAVCVVSDRRVGADVERLSRFDGKRARMEQVARRVLTGEEWQAWNRNPTGEALVTLWTKKESYVKYTGKGLSCDFSAVDTLNGACFVSPAIRPDYALSICVGDTPPEGEPQIYWWKPDDSGSEL